MINKFVSIFFCSPLWLISNDEVALLGISFHLRDDTLMLCSLNVYLIAYVLTSMQKSNMYTIHVFSIFMYFKSRIYKVCARWHKSSVKIVAALM